MIRRLRGVRCVAIELFKPTGVDLIHHVVAAIMMAMLTLALDHAHVLDWLDAGMLRIVGARSGHFETKTDPFVALRPAVVEIDRQAYSTIFDERSPLDRSKLASILGHLDVPSVGVIAIDIDLSPVPSDRAREGPDVLDAAVDRLARSGKAVVLVLPDASDGDAKLSWVRDRCGVPGISFATPLIRERFGAVTLAETRIPTLSAVAFAKSSSRTGGEDLARRVCELAAQNPNDQVLTQVAGEALAPDGDLPLHPDAVAFRYLFPTTSGVVDRAGDVGLEDETILRRVVFVGGDFERSDRFRTADGITAGLFVHAAMFTSLGTATHRLKTGWGFVADVGSAIVLGLLFAGIWAGYGRVEARGLARGRDLVPPSPRTLAAVGEILVVRLAIVLVWAVPVVLTVMVFILAQHVLLHGTWVNPGTLVIGMFLDSRSARKEGAEVAGTRGANAQQPTQRTARADRWPSWLGHLATHHPDTLVTQPLIILLLGCVLFFQQTAH